MILPNDELASIALDGAENTPPTAKNIEHLSKQTSPEHARWAFTQWELRKKAVAKFSRAREMLFTREALEQATNEEVAKYHAEKFPSGAPVADLTAGIGADSIALALRGPVIAFEKDPTRAAYCKHNLDVYGVAANVMCEDALASDWDFDFAYADPSRRTGSRRTLNPNLFEPSIESLLEKMAKLKFGIVKLSPAMSGRDLQNISKCIEFVSFGGECREALAHINLDCEGFSAVHIETRARLPAGQPGPATEEPLAWLLEADPAAIRADCLGTLCAQLDAFELGDSNGYLTAAREGAWPWSRSYRVLAHGKFDERVLKATVRQLGIGKAIVKTRGVPTQRQELKFGTGKEAILALYPVGKSARFCVLESPRNQ